MGYKERKQLARSLSLSEVARLSHDEAGGVCQLLGLSARGTRDELIASIMSTLNHKEK